MKSFFRRLFWLPLALMLCIVLWLSPVNASALSDPRLAQLEFEVNALQSQVNQLQNQLSRSTNTSVPTSPTDRPIERPVNLEDPTLDEQFDNLATLVIELNQRVLQIEDRLADLAP